MVEVFEGITVLDLSRGMPGSIATMIMSDFGAEVIKVEPPGGDPFRDWPGGVQWNRGKKSVVLDLKTSEGRSKSPPASPEVRRGGRELPPRDHRTPGRRLRDSQHRSARPGVLLPYRLRPQGSLRTLQGLRGRGGRQEREDDGVCGAEQARGPQLRRSVHSQPLSRHGPGQGSHSGPAGTGQDGPGPEGGDQPHPDHQHLRPQGLDPLAG